jgi:proline dehydrogenase
MSVRKSLLLRVLKSLPEQLVWRFARTYIAGRTLDDAASTIELLAQERCMATLDVLGEDVALASEVEIYVAEYQRALARIAQQQLPANISVKPSAMGLAFDPELAFRSVCTLTEAAREAGNFVRLDMEDRTLTSKTLDLYRRLRAQDIANVGVVLQAYLRRTLGDAAELAAMGASVRLCKGIYIEPREVAYQHYDTVRQSFVSTLRVLFERGASKVGIATHDEWLVQQALAMIQQLEIPTSRYEFQMLLGVDPQLRRLLAGAGHPLRVYVPYGAGWQAYSLRRLIENPRVASHVVKNVLGLGPGSRHRGAD